MTNTDLLYGGDDSTSGGLDWNALADSGGNGSTGSNGGNSTSWLGTLGQLATAGANAYRTASQPAAKPKTSPLLLIGGALVLVLVLVLALRK